MTLPLPFQVKDSDTQANFDQIAQQFPISSKNLATRTMYGTVGSAGGISVAGSGDWSVSRTALGHYTLTFTHAFTSTPVIICNAVQALAFPSVPPTTTGVVIFVENGGATAFIDADFGFIATGI